MNYALVFRPEVRDELDEAFQWYERQKVGLGDEFLDCIDEMLNRVCLMPEAYPVVYRDVRRVVVKRFPYAIYIPHCFQSHYRHSHISQSAQSEILAAALIDLLAAIAP